MEPTFQQYLEAVSEAIVQHPSWRPGQAYFNVLAAMRPDIAEGDVRGSTIDPFHRDSRIASFLAFVGAEWDGIQV